jgi:predicted DNA-binding protein (MmcQ/YjbR family)
MVKPRYSDENKEILDSILLEVPEVEPGQAFGYPAYYVNGKMFACLYEDGVAVKMPPEAVEELKRQEGVFEFRPMDKHVMKQWVLIKRDSPRGYLDDRDKLMTSIEYVFSISKEK